MSAKFYTLLTDIGAAKLASAAALGVPLKITQMAVGDGGGVLPTPSAQQTALVAEKRRASLNMLYIDPQNSSQIIAEQVIPETEGGWWIREVGLFDETGALIAVGNCPESYKPQLAEGSGRTQTVRMVLITSSTDNITLKIDPAVVLATRKYVDDKVLELKVYVDDLMAKHTAASDPHTQYAPKASPTFTGTPKAPTAAAGNNSTQLANTAFVQAAIAALVDSSPGALDTLNELAKALGNDPSFATTMTNALAGKMDKAANGKDIADVSEFLKNLGLGDANGYVGRKIAEQWITSSKLLTLNPRTKYFKVVITGAGGGGGGAFNGGGSNDNFSGGGGAAGGTGIKWFRVADVTNWAVVIGSGGTEATKGGDSSFSGIVAPGGAPAVASTVFAAGGTGVVGTGADINLAGGDGGDGQNGAFLLSGFGGASYWGGSRRAGQGQSGSTIIPKAKVPGAGGGGAFDTQKMGVRFYGGQGADGICFIEEYA
ncbi:phage tail protein [Escherichia coli]|nr:phage tail protein [Escherichia coli]